MIHIDIFIQIYWLYALLSALVFWRLRGWSVLLPLAGFVIGSLLYMRSDIVSSYAQALFITALFCLGTVFLRYSFPSNRQETENDIF